MMTIQTLSYVEQPARSGNTQELVIFLHGWGSDGENLLSLAPFFADFMPHTHFIAPNAPERCDMSPSGYQWFSLSDWSPESMERGARAAHPILSQFIDSTAERLGIAENKIALVGFSQGTMMSLFTALRRPHALAGIVGYSGALIGSESLGREITSRPPVCLIHGTADSVVPFKAMEHASQSMQALGLEVESHARAGLVHSIDEEGIRIATAFLTKCFA
jgi:phospholipase/carboxylesterase